MKRLKPADSTAPAHPNPKATSYSSSLPFTTQPCAIHGWPNSLKLASPHLELIVTLDVGPRVLSFRRLPDGQNVFKTYPEQLGGVGELEWKIRGGHRLWSAPESALTYALDNEPVDKWDVVGDEVVLTSCAGGVEKVLGITLVDSGTAVRVRHRVGNNKIANDNNSSNNNSKDVGSSKLVVAPWALTVCRPGGTELIPQPALGQREFASWWLLLLARLSFSRFWGRFGH